MRARRHPCALFLPLAAALALASPARAGDALDEAQVEFDKAMDLKMGDKDCKAAMPHFERAWVLRKSYELAANMGDCELQLSRFPGAAERLRYAQQNLSVAATPGDRKAVGDAFQKARAKVGAVKIQTNVADAVISVNGTVAGKAPLPDEVFVEPGAVAVRATREGYEAGEAKVESIAPGGSASVTVTLNEIKKALPPPPPPPPKKDLTPGLSLVGVGGAVLLAGVGLQIGGAALAGDASKQAAPGICTDEASQACKDFRGTASLQRAVMTTSVVAYVAGAALAGVGVVLLALPGPKPKPAVGLVPWVGPDGAGVLAAGSF